MASLSKIITYLLERNKCQVTQINVKLLTGARTGMAGQTIVELI